MSNEDDRIPLSALQHYAFCPRQCALIHLSRVWDENLYTQRGCRVHERVDQGKSTSRGGVRIERSLPLWSDLHGLTGKADVVEFSETGKPYPVEYKSGRKKHSLPDRIQLAGQVLCLEEMFDCTLAEGALFYHRSRHREIVPINSELRDKTLSVIADVRKLLSHNDLPPACNDTRCRHCSLADACLPTLREALAEKAPT